MGRTVLAVVIVILVASLGLNVYMAVRYISVMQKNESLMSGTIVVNGTTFDVTALQLNNDTYKPAEGTVVLFRNVTFTYVPNASNGSQWLEFVVKPVGGNVASQDLRAYWWPPGGYPWGRNETFTKGMSPTAGVMVKSTYPSYVYLLVSVQS